MLWRAKRLLAAATGPTGRDDAEREPISLGYCWRLAGLVWSGKVPAWVGIWALRARPASVCGRGGSYAVADGLSMDDEYGELIGFGTDADDRADQEVGFGWDPDTIGSDVVSDEDEGLNRQRDEVHCEFMERQWVWDRAGECGTCDGIGLDLFEDVGDLCKVCGGAGKWDSGEDVPAAFDVETTEPRISADLIR
jgi:hypothetical protein